MSIIPLPQLLALLCCCGLAAATQGERRAVEGQVIRFT
ncbi:rCG57263 [Rattus norvegicus]|uniref:RCG57263 n=1 Tax=Rattus norvegicus TaxID=10116 RepID=A6KT09_RAT|nr:rCG57263 [Rattus norvegicus]